MNSCESGTETGGGGVDVQSCVDCGLTCAMADAQSEVIRTTSRLHDLRAES